MKFLPKCCYLMPMVVGSFCSEAGWCDSGVSSQQTASGSASVTLNGINPGLPSIALDRLSSAALRMLDQGGNLVKPAGLGSFHKPEEKMKSVPLTPALSPGGGEGELVSGFV